MEGTNGNGCMDAWMQRENVGQFFQVSSSCLGKTCLNLIKQT